MASGGRSPFNMYYEAGTEVIIKPSWKLNQKRYNWVKLYVNQNTQC